MTATIGLTASSSLTLWPITAFPHASAHAPRSALPVANMCNKLPLENHAPPLSQIYLLFLIRPIKHNPSDNFSFEPPWALIGGSMVS